MKVMRFNQLTFSKYIFTDLLLLSHISLLEQVEQNMVLYHF